MVIGIFCPAKWFIHTHTLSWHYYPLLRQEAAKQYRHTQ